MMFLMITIKYLGGKTALTQSYIAGIFSMGKINPDNRIVGSIIPTREMKIACCMVLETVEISIPSDRDIRIYNMLTSNRSIRLPLTGSLKTNQDNRRITTTLIKESKK
jgi:predicted transcriptional regulator